MCPPLPAAFALSGDLPDPLPAIGCRRRGLWRWCACCARAPMRGASLCVCVVCVKTCGVTLIRGRAHRLFAAPLMVTNEKIRIIKALTWAESEVVVPDVELLQDAHIRQLPHNVDALATPVCDVRV